MSEGEFDPKQIIWDATLADDPEYSAYAERPSPESDVVTVVVKRDGGMIDADMFDLTNGAAFGVEATDIDSWKAFIDMTVENDKKMRAAMAAMKKKGGG